MTDNSAAAYSLHLLDMYFLYRIFTPPWNSPYLNLGWLVIFPEKNYREFVKQSIVPTIASGLKLQLILILSFLVATTLQFNNSARSCALHLLTGVVPESKPQCPYTSSLQCLVPRESTFQHFHLSLP